MQHFNVVILFVMVLNALPCVFAGVPDGPGAPPLNGSAEDFAQFRQKILNVIHNARSATDWVSAKSVDGVSLSHRTDPSSGCPWVRGIAELAGCTVRQSAEFIISNISKTEPLWDHALVSNTLLRNMTLPDGRQTVVWHVDNDGVFLAKRAYYLYDGWQWTAIGDIIEDASVSIHSELPPPSGGANGVRSTQWAWKRLQALSSTVTRYEVLWLSDIKGVVPCSWTASAQASVMQKEVENFRRLIPCAASKDAGNHLVV
mmetsp:Transcript_94996/g.188182  ORF Transcript_94996/g.188182 Transcript_94996/m.188182 type:complete len:258 (-) Transcript_94996:208-981(-)